MRVLLALTIFGCGLVSFGSAQMFGFGKCPQTETQQNFDVDLFMGEWHELMRYSLVWGQMGKMCKTVTYSQDENGTVNYNVSTISTNWFDMGKKHHMAGRLNQSVAHGDYTKLNFTSDMGNWTLKVVETDYDSYAILTTCTEHSFFYTDVVWVMGRSRELTKEMKQDLVSKVNTAGLRGYLLTNTAKQCDKLHEKMDKMD